MRQTRLARLLAAAALLAALFVTPPGRAEDAAKSPDLRSRRREHTRTFGPEDRLAHEWVTADRFELKPTATGDDKQGDALAVPVSFPDTTEIWLDRPVALVNLNPPDGAGALAYSRIGYSVYVPPNARGRLQAALLLKDKDGLFYTGVSRSPLRPGRWNRIIVDLGDQSLDLVPRGHAGRWNLHRLTTIQRIGFSFWGDRPLPGEQAELLLDDITTWPLDSEALCAASDLRITGLSVPRKTIAQYERFEATFWLNRPVLNPFDQRQVELNVVFTPPGGDASQASRVPAFYYQPFARRPSTPRDRFLPSGAGVFCVRFTPRKAGTYTWHIEASYRAPDRKDAPRETCTSPTQTLTITPRAHRGFIRGSKEHPRYFEFENGDFYFPVGHNYRSPTDLRDWKEIVRKCYDAKAPKPVDRGLKIYEERVPRIAAAGENLIEIWMCSWWLALEWSPHWKNYHGLGSYNMTNAYRLDRLFELCAEHGINIQLVIDNHGKASMKPQVDHEWEYSPYNTRNGGFLTIPDHLFDLENHPEVRIHYRNRLRYIAARWGYATNLFAFEMWSELDLTGRRHGRHRDFYATDKVRNWHREMIRYLNTVDHADHLVTTHYSGDYSHVDRAMVAMPEIDFMACDAYHAPKQSLVEMLQTTERISSGKRYLVTEFGGNWNAAIPAQIEADLHTGLWFSWVSEKAGTPLLWWFDQIEREDLYFHFRAFSRFIAGEDKRPGPGEGPLRSWPIALANGKDQGLAVLATGNGRRGYAWVYAPEPLKELPPEDGRPVHDGISIALPDLQEGSYRVEVWDTWKGVCTQAQTLETEGGVLLCELPRFGTDTAVKYGPASPAAGEKPQPTASTPPAATRPPAPTSQRHR